MHTQKRQRNEPKQKKTNHSIRLDTLALGDAIAQRQKRRPDGSNHALDRVGAVHVLNREPEDGEDGARYDGDVGPPETPGGAG